jgi:hypothetical protein
MATDPKTGQPIFHRHGVGIHNVGSYQSSGWPYITGSTINNMEEKYHAFPMVAKAVTVIASGAFGTNPAALLRVHFASTSSDSAYVIDGHHYVSMESDDQSITFNSKCKGIYLSALGSDVGYEVVAELTNIPTDRMFALTGSGVTDIG